MIEWGAFVLVLLASLLSACAVVSTFALGIRLLAVAGRPPIASPVEFTDALAVMTPDEIAAAEKRAAKAARKSPLTVTQKRLANLGAYLCFGLSGVAALLGILLLVI